VQFGIFRTIYAKVKSLLSSGDEDADDDGDEDAEDEPAGGAEGVVSRSFFYCVTNWATYFTKEQRTRLAEKESLKCCDVAAQRLVPWLDRSEVAVQAKLHKLMRNADAVTEANARAVLAALKVLNSEFKIERAKAHCGGAVTDDVDLKLRKDAALQELDGT